MLRLLVVDDVSERITDIEQEALFSFPGEDILVMGAKDVAEAMRVFEENEGKFHMVVLDLKLPSFPEGSGDEGGLYLLRKFTRRSPRTTYVLSSGSLPEGTIPEVDFPKEFPSENFHCVPKSAQRSRLVKILQDLVAAHGTPAPA